MTNTETEAPAEAEAGPKPLDDVRIEEITGAFHALRLAGLTVALVGDESAIAIEVRGRYINTEELGLIFSISHQNGLKPSAINIGNEYGPTMMLTPLREFAGVEGLNDGHVAVDGELPQPEAPADEDDGDYKITRFGDSVLLEFADSDLILTLSAIGETDQDKAVEVLEHSASRVMERVVASGDLDVGAAAAIVAEEQKTATTVFGRVLASTD